GYLVHFQDELGQMKGHGHVWEVREVSPTGFTARVLAGNKPLDDKLLKFTLDPKCRAWSKGKKVKPSVRARDRVYLTWCLREGKRVVHLLADDASMDAVKKEEQERLAKEVAREGIAGKVEGVEGSKVRFMVYATGWSQAGQLKAGQQVSLSGTGKGFRPTGPR